MSKVWFITGAGSGIGIGTAKAALRSGDRVVATGRNFEKVRNVYPDVAQENIAFVRTVDGLSSSDKAGKSFAARLDDNLVVKGRVVIPAGSKVYGRVDSSQSAGRAFGQSKLALSLRKIVVDGRPVAIATGEFEESGTRSGRKTARRAAAGTLIGFALGGPALGAAIGASTGLIGQGKSIEAPAGTLLEFRLARSVVL
jgi:short chain dehydrogenase